MLDKLAQEELADLTAKFGAGWCGCFREALSRLTPKALADYCKREGYKPFPEPITDEVTGDVRYAYLVDEDSKTVASFGDFKHFPKATLEGILSSIWKIAAIVQIEPIEIVKLVTTKQPAKVSD